MSTLLTTLGVLSSLATAPPDHLIVAILANMCAAAPLIIVPVVVLLVTIFAHPYASVHFAPTLYEFLNTDSRLFFVRCELPACFLQAHDFLNVLCVLCMKRRKLFLKPHLPVFTCCFINRIVLFHNFLVFVQFLSVGPKAITLCNQSDCFFIIFCYLLSLLLRVLGQELNLEFQLSAVLFVS